MTAAALTTATVARVTEPRPDWPDVLPEAFTVTPRRAPYVLLLVSIVLLVLGLAVVATTSDDRLRLPLLALSTIVGLFGVSALSGFLQAGRPHFVADAVGVKTPITPMRIPWERVERVRIMPGRRGRGVIGVIPLSLEEALGATASERMIKLLKSRQSREGAPLIASLVATGISRDEAQARLTELAANRAPITD